MAQSVRDIKGQEQKRVLLRISNLWLLAAFTSLSLLNFLWFRITVLSLIFPIFIVIGIIYSFWQVIFTLLNPDVLEKNRIKLLKERMKRIILDSIRERIGNSILFNKIGQDKEIKLEYTFSKSWLDKRLGEYLFIESDRDGWLSDINLNELDKLVKRLEDSAQLLGFSLFIDTVPSLEGGGESKITQQSQVQSGRAKKAYLLRRYGEYLPPRSIFTEESKIVLALPKEFGQDQSLVEYVRNLVPHIFRFKQTEPASNAFRIELQGTKDQLVAAIRSVSLGSIEEQKETYLHLAESFLEMLHQFGGGYSADQARKEEGNIFEGWDEIRWLRQDIRELIVVAAASDNRDVVSDIAFLPIAIAVRAVQAKDHYLFRQFVDFSPFIYYLTKDKPDSQLKSFMIDHSWRYLKEVSEMYIEPQLRDSDDKNDAESLKEYKDFALNIFRVFQTLLKATLDNNDIRTFKIIAAEFKRLFRHFDPKNDHPNAEYLEQSLNWTTSSQEKAKIQDRIIIQRAKESAGEDIELAKEQILLGVSAYILEKYRQNQGSDSLKNFFDEINQYLPGDLIRLTKVYDSSRDFRVEDSWGWGDWEMIADGEVHTIDVHSKLDRLYCVKALQILETQNEESIAKMRLPHSRGLAYLAEERPGANSLMEILGRIDSDPQEWKFALSDEQRAKVAALKNLLQQAKKDQEEAEEAYLKRAAIDPDKLKQFKKELQDGFSKSGRLRPIAKRLGVYRDLTNETSKIPYWGYN